ncbi:Holliday junction branch migration protein RuvA [Paenalcaligenes niemegkensis]|uniref:Holliday junction branch migration protein RuvA n=1 Tax=Paenalcaligenes niemegkensis TaxID=2895469 RepID=UPI001EE82888|nr:Holliday junction branch migration protein RuvA [Paenalcaligenes niemegkensis]MCQ9617113.1 Holliday junction branch migration protein RuvA [Paenalcaligenes niemegkensis]
MIGRISGTLIEKLPPSVCIDVNGVGYDIDVPMSTFYGLGDLNSKVSLFTHLSVREDAHVLYGFATPSERSTFRTLIKVSGIGARTALSILSGLSVQDLSAAINQQETALLTSVPGIGKKTAERLLLELRGKLEPDTGDVTVLSAGNTDRSDILNALLALGYNSTEANKALKQLAEDVSVSDGIRLALQSLSKR